MRTINNFDTFRRWFNRNFSLSVNGKFKGLSTLLSLVGERYLERFAIKLDNMMTALERGYLHGESKVYMKLKGFQLCIRLR